MDCALPLVRGRYRLQQITIKTGLDPRTFTGLVDLICILEMTDNERPPFA